MPVSEDVLRLVRTVERLPSEDQDKILRMVDLLTLVPVPVQNTNQRMLRELLERQPDTKRECVAGVDDVLAYLERNAAAASQVARPRDSSRVRRCRARCGRLEPGLLRRDLHHAGPGAPEGFAPASGSGPRSSGSGRRRENARESAAKPSCASCHSPRRNAASAAANAARPCSSQATRAPPVGSSYTHGKPLAA